MSSRGERRDLTGEHSIGDLGQVLLLILFLAVWIVDSFVLGYTDFLGGLVPLALRIVLAILILAAGVYFAWAGHRVIFDEVRETPEVVRKGVYGRVRHPLYLGAILFYLGLLVLTLSLAAAALWLVIVGFYHFISRYEELLLRGRFGEKYVRYMNDVPMWIPRLRSGPDP